jgi:hypothetical protein
VKHLTDAIANLSHDLESLAHHTGRTPVALVEDMPQRLEYCAAQAEQIAAAARNLAEEARNMARGA